MGRSFKLMMMKMVKGLNLKGAAEMRRAAGAAFAAKNRTLNKGGVSPLQAVTGRNSMVPGSIMEQLASGRMRFRYNEAASTKEAVARAERIRIGALGGLPLAGCERCVEACFGLAVSTAPA